MTKKLDLTKMKPKDYFIVFLKGILLGLISVGIPGISASTVGIIVGIYFLMVESIAGIFKDFKHNFPFLIILILGYSLGAIGAAASISLLYKQFPLIVTFAVIGFLFGAIPDMLKDLKGGFKKVSNWICLIVVVALLLVYNFTLRSNAQINFPDQPSWGFLAIMLGIGLVTSATFVVPGVDFAVVFLAMGIYYAFTNMILQLVSFGSADYMKHFVANIEILAAYMIGYLVGMFLFSKLIKMLSKKYESQSRFASFGFIVTAPVIVVKSCLYDNDAFSMGSVTKVDIIVGILLMIFFLWLTFFIMKKARVRAEKLDPEAGPLEEDHIDNSWHLPRRMRKLFYKDGLLAVHLNQKLKRLNKKQHSVEEAYRVCLPYVHKYFKEMDVVIEKHGLEYLESLEGGVCYMGNHQGTNDCMIVLDSIESHPATFLINDDRSHMFLMGPICDYMKAKRINFHDLRGQIKTFQEIGKELQDGNSFIVFPEAMYNGNKNTLNHFNTPCFAPVLKSKSPIVPFVLFDTYKTIDNEFKGMLKVQIHFLKPINYEDYKDLTKQDLATLLQNRIQAKLDELSLPDERKIFEEVEPMENV